MGAHDNKVNGILLCPSDDLDEGFAFLKDDLIILEPSHFFHIMTLELSIDFLLLASPQFFKFFRGQIERKLLRMNGLGGRVEYQEFGFVRFGQVEGVSEGP